jgi:hypothetical protein
LQEISLGAVKEKGIHLSWESIRNIMATQQRVTLMLPTDANTTILLRTTTRPEALHQQLYQALNIKPDPDGKRKTIIDRKNPSANRFQLKILTC